MELINDSVIFLSGFLKGLAEIDGDIREKNLYIFDVENDPLIISRRKLLSIIIIMLY